MSPLRVFSLGSTGLSLHMPSDGDSFTGCAYYSLPVFNWYAFETFKGFELQVSSDEGFASVPVKIKSSGTEVDMKSSILKKILLLPGTNGGAVYWRVVGTRQDKSTEQSEVNSIFIEAAHEVGNPRVSSTSRSALPSLFLDNNCGKKFKVWFGNDSSFTKKSTISVSVKNPLDNGGVLNQGLTSNQWSAIRKLVGDASGSTIYWKVESWDGVNRHAETTVMSFVLTD
jgi:hypothetical protein